MENDCRGNTKQNELDCRDADPLTLAITSNDFAADSVALRLADDFFSKFL